MKPPGGCGELLGAQAGLCRPDRANRAMTTSASLLTSVYRTMRARTNVREPLSRKIAVVRRRERLSQLQTCQDTREAHLCTDGLVTHPGGELTSRTGAQATGISSMQTRNQAVPWNMYDIVPLGISASSGAVDVVVELSPACPFSLARGTVRPVDHGVRLRKG